jgi:hypothetical protein
VLNWQTIRPLFSGCIFSFNKSSSSPGSTIISVTGTRHPLPKLQNQ